MIILRLHLHQAIKAGHNITEYYYKWSQRQAEKCEIIASTGPTMISTLRHLCREQPNTKNYKISQTINNVSLSRSHWRGEQLA